MKSKEELKKELERLRLQKELEHAEKVLKDRMLWIIKQVNAIQSQEYLTKEDEERIRRFNEEFAFLHEGWYELGPKKLYLEWKKRYGGDSQC